MSFFTLVLKSSHLFVNACLTKIINKYKYNALNLGAMAIKKKRRGFCCYAKKQNPLGCPPSKRL
jgi:hypothetical protein